MRDWSMISISPIVAVFTLISPAACANLYSVFLHDPMRMFSTRKSPSLKDWEGLTMKDDMQATHNNIKKGTISQSFNAIKRSKLKAANPSFQKIRQRQSPMGLHVNFSKADRPSKLNGYFTKSRSFEWLRLEITTQLTLLVNPLERSSIYIVPIAALQWWNAFRDMFRCMASYFNSLGDLDELKMTSRTFEYLSIHLSIKQLICLLIIRPSSKRQMAYSRWYTRWLMHVAAMH